ncbi:MAG: cysteine hydrolase family protein [Acutalibacteraceae bacterium]
MSKTLIVVDMQNDFIFGALGTPAAVAILPRVKRKIDDYLAHGWKVIFTRDTHGEDYLATREGRQISRPHCIVGTAGHRIADELDVPACLHLDKPSFGTLKWADFDLNDIEIVGVCTDICVISNALILRAAFPESPITVDVQCCAGTTPSAHKAALQIMRGCGISVINE